MTRRAGFIVSVALLSPLIMLCWCVVGVVAGALGCAEMLYDQWRAL